MLYLWIFRTYTEILLSIKTIYISNIANLKENHIKPAWYFGLYIRHYINSVNYDRNSTFLRSDHSEKKNKTAPQTKIEHVYVSYLKIINTYFEK